MPSPTRTIPRADGWVAKLLDRLLHLHDTPARTAAAFAVGVFFSFSPFLGLQILLSMAVAFALKLNRAAVFLGLNANLPWFIVPWYGSMTLLAATALGGTAPGEALGLVESLFANDLPAAGFFSRAASVLRPILVPFLVGSTLGAALLGVVTFWVARAWLERKSAPAPE